MQEELYCGDCGKQFYYGDTLYFKPIPYLEEFEGMEVEISPYCKNCIEVYVIDNL